MQTSADGPEVIGMVTIPDRKMTVKVTIHRNTDTSLPASHLVELMITTPADFAGKSVQTIPNIFMSSSDTDTGDVLVGASATVGMGLYWVALSSAAKDVTGNIGLMQTRGWLDIHLVYQTGQRASLVLEKGQSGQQAFAKAISAWQTG